LDWRRRHPSESRRPGTRAKALRDESCIRQFAKVLLHYALTPTMAF
jgi:hypothetical protein